MSPIGKHHVVTDGFELVGRTIVQAEISPDGPALMLDDDSVLLLRVHEESDDPAVQIERVWMQRPPKRKRAPKRAKRKGARKGAGA